MKKYFFLLLPQIILRFLSVIDFSAAYIKACGGLISGLRNSKVFKKTRAALLSFMLKNSVLTNKDEDNGILALQSIRRIPCKVMRVDRASALGLVSIRLSE